MADLLFELGCEEIPAKMLARALAELPAMVEQRLASARLPHQGVRALGTPRRLAVIVKQLADRQPDIREDVVGPPASAAFAPDGTLTKAGQGFAAKNGVAPEALSKREVAGKKGLYVVATRELVGQPARALLPAMLAELCAQIPWPKSMRWGWSEVGFVRPVQWLVALYGGEVLPLQWAGQTAGRVSRGHRFLANHPVEVAADDYERVLRAAHVVVDPGARRIQIEAELARLAGDCRVRPDPALLDEVVNLGEWPVGISGGFDPAYLDIPEEIVVTAMRAHQRYFAMESAGSKLAPRFATMMATIVKDTAVVVRGNEKVLAARLADAKFFFADDCKKSFAAWNTKLDGVVFQAKLAEPTIGAKVRRIAKIVEGLTTSPAARRAAQVCKADLASGVVGEFPELQGTMGRHYARVFGEPELGDIIEQHWWPKGQGGALPATDDARAVALADRIDTLVGCFATGLIPTGNADPLGLRRAAIGILQMLLAHGGALSTLIDLAVATLALADRQPLVEFFKHRLRSILVDDEGLDASVVEVTLGAGFDVPADALARARGLAVLPASTKAVFKRIGNILDDAAGKGFGKRAVPDANRFVAPVERALHGAHAAVAKPIDDALAAQKYRDAFVQLASLGEPLAAFFDKGGVMVMDPDPELRENRLALLRAIYEPFARIGDFRKLGGTS